MNTEFLSGLPHWYAIHTKPKQEVRAESNLKAWNIETFAPRVKVHYHDPYSSEPSYRVRPFFPNYIFARFEAGSMLHKVSFTRGVNCVVGFGAGPTPIDDEIIRIVQSQVAEDGYVRTSEELTYGNKVMIIKGPFKSLTGIFERRTTEAERVMILLTTVKFQSHIVVERELIKKIN